MSAVVTGNHAMSCHGGAPNTTQQRRGLVSYPGRWRNPPPTQVAQVEQRRASVTARLAAHTSGAPMTDDVSDDGDQTDLVAAHPLMAPLSPAQQAFVDVLFRQMATSGSWPIFDWVRRVLRNRGIDAAAELARLPHALNRERSGRQYRHVWIDGGGIAVSENSRVQLTIAGLLAESSGAGKAFADFLARVVAEIAEIESNLVPDPDTPPVATVELTDVLQRVQGHRAYGDYVDLIGSVLSREEPVFGCASRSGQPESMTWKVNLRDDLSLYLGITDSKDYLHKLLVSMGVDRPREAPPSNDRPLALVDEIGYLDAVWQARVDRRSLFGAARVASCAGLTLSSSTSEEFDSRMNALYDVLNRIDVELTPEDELEMKSQGRSGSLQRLRQKMRTAGLPEEDFERVDASIGALQDAIRIRAALHSGVEGELPARYRRLGLSYPPADYGAAWDNVRIRCAGAVRSIRQTLETLP